jgi:hypothetical protein
LPFFSFEKRIAFAVTFSYICAHSQASKLFRCRCVPLRLYSFFYQPLPLLLSSFLTYTILYAALRQGPYCASRTFACECVFSTHFAAAAITIRHHIHSRRRRTYTHIHKAKLLAHTHTHTRPLQRVCSMFEKKKQDENAETYTYIYTHIYIYVMCVRFLSLSILPFS